MHSEIRVSSIGRLSSSIHYATKLLTDNDNDNLKVKAMGNAIPKAISLVESVKRKFPYLHQNTSIGTYILEGTQAPTDTAEEKEYARPVTYIEIILSKNFLDMYSPGYQAPLPESAIQEYEEYMSKTNKRKSKKRVSTSNKSNKNSPSQSIESTTNPTAYVTESTSPGVSSAQTTPEIANSPRASNQNRVRRSNK